MGVAGTPVLLHLVPGGQRKNMVRGSYCQRKGVYILLGKQVGWDQLEHEIAVGKELKHTENGSHEISGQEWIREWRSQNV